ncbi:hypothetical protein DAPPUDRAFT_119316 [Daphnia pulex]|uniref:Uncharacterized protein n=1 Tax=Daphnia pulex TaxID=6669 RepID=E9HY59_DAPPU|nr:hypothetical protein DAPPUDRAFT_119316 [Daphnia pulex]|eukprot:EFX63322.1 hypothetical protein DAPPUDRAFT_119316 [Daphnia pulex]
MDVRDQVYTASEESGAEDSDEDIITDYLSPLDDNGNLDAGASAATSSSSPGAAVAAINVAAISTRFYSTESPPSSLRISAAEDMEPAGAAAADGGVGGTGDRMISNYATAAAAAAAAESIPIISVTQHSPAASKAFFILGEISNPFSPTTPDERLKIGQPSAVARHPGEYPADETSQRADTTTPGIQLAIITSQQDLFFPIGR